MADDNPLTLKRKRRRDEDPIDTLCMLSVLHETQKRSAALTLEDISTSSNKRQFTGPIPDTGHVFLRIPAENDLDDTKTPDTNQRTTSHKAPATKPSKLILLSIEHGSHKRKRSENTGETKSNKRNVVTVIGEDSKPRKRVRDTPAAFTGQDSTLGGTVVPDALLEMAAEEAAKDGDMMEEDDEAEYIYDTYALAPISSFATAPTITTNDADSTDLTAKTDAGGVGYLVLSREDARDFYDQYGLKYAEDTFVSEDNEDGEWDSEQDDENAENYYANDYPDEHRYDTDYYSDEDPRMREDENGILVHKSAGFRSRRAMSADEYYKSHDDEESESSEDEDEDEDETSTGNAGDQLGIDHVDGDGHEYDKHGGRIWRRGGSKPMTEWDRYLHKKFVGGSLDDEKVDDDDDEDDDENSKKETEGEHADTSMTEN